MEQDNNEEANELQADTPHQPFTAGETGVDDDPASLAADEDDARNLGDENEQHLQSQLEEDQQPSQVVINETTDLLTRSDKAVWTQDAFEDLQRALTYEAVFSSLIEKKVLAMKRDCEERKRAKRMKRKSLGRIFLTKKLFGSRKNSVCSRADSSSTHEPTGHTPPTTSAALKKTAKKSHTIDIIDIVSVSSASEPNQKTRQKAHSISTANVELQVLGANRQRLPTAAQAADDSLASTLSNSSDKPSQGLSARHSLLVQAQTHTPAGQSTTTSSSPAEQRQSLSIGMSTAPGTANVGQASLLERAYDVSSLGSDNGNIRGDGATGGSTVVHTSTMADDSLTSDLRDSIESLSFASSRCTVSFGGTEIIPEETASLLYERAKIAKRKRILEAKSISAQCSPIFPPKYALHMLPQPLGRPPPGLTQSRTQTQVTIPSQHVGITVSPSTVSSEVMPKQSPSTLTGGTGTTTTVATSRRMLPKQTSYTDSTYGGVGADDINAAYARYFSRQNTSEESANITISTLLNQSDSVSLHAPTHFASTYPTTASDLAGIALTRSASMGDRSKSKNASLLSASGPIRSRPPLPPQHIQQERCTTESETFRTKVPAVRDEPMLPIGQFEQLSIGNTLRSHKAILVDNNALVSHGAMIDQMNAVPVGGTPLTAITSNGNALPYSLANGAITASSVTKLHRMTSTSTGSSVAPTGCCATAKSREREREKQRFNAVVPLGQTGSDDEYRRRKRKYKRHHRCSDPVLVYPTPNGLQHCILAIPSTETGQFAYTEDYAYDMQLPIDLIEKSDDLEEIVPNSSSNRRHRRHRHHRHKKRHRHKKHKILVQDLETQVVKVINHDDLPQRARWTIIATACFLLLMCLMLVGITLRMAPFIDDIGK